MLRITLFYYFYCSYSWILRIFPFSNYLSLWGILFICIKHSWDPKCFVLSNKIQNDNFGFWNSILIRFRPKNSPVFSVTDYKCFNQNFIKIDNYPTSNLNLIDKHNLRRWSLKYLNILNFFSKSKACERYEAVLNICKKCMLRIYVHLHTKAVH